MIPVMSAVDVRSTDRAKDDHLGIEWHATAFQGVYKRRVGARPREQGRTSDRASQ